MNNQIGPFKGNYFWLSNFYPVNIVFDDRIYPTVEHAYVAAKTLDQDARDAIVDILTPAKAKEFGKTVVIRPNWDRYKIIIMKKLLHKKFRYPSLRKLLLNTGDAELVEVNYWGDTFWGVCKGVGNNKLGKLLMEVRSEIRG